MSNVATEMKAFIAKFSSAAAVAAAGTKIFPETILTAAALESGYGKSALAAKHNNFFGIKADSTWKGKYVIMPAKEQDTNGNEYTVNARFRHYDNPQQSFANYVVFVSGPRYVKAGVLKAPSPVQQFEKIKAAGYASDVKYVDKLKAIFNSVQSWVMSNPAATGSVGIAIAFLLFFLTTNKKTKPRK